MRVFHDEMLDAFDLVTLVTSTFGGPTKWAGRVEPAVFFDPTDDCKIVGGTSPIAFNLFQGYLRTDEPFEGNNYAGITYDTPRSFSDTAFHEARHVWQVWVPEILAS